MTAQFMEILFYKGKRCQWLSILLTIILNKNRISNLYSILQRLAEQPKLKEEGQKNLTQIAGALNVDVFSKTAYHFYAKVFK